MFSSEPSSIALGDLNNDKQIDAVVADSGTDSISIFLSINNQTLAKQKTYSTGFKSRPYSITISDFNHDNYPDIAVANYGANNIGIFLGNANGTFGIQNTFSTGSSHPRFITTGDFNNDNQSDIAVVNYGTDSIGILLGNGDGSFQMQTTYSTGYDSHPYSLAVGDFNNDSHLDIVVTNYGLENIGIFLGHGNATFDKQTTYSTGSNSHPQCISVGYFNQDKYFDVVVLDSDNAQLHIIPGNGIGNFGTLTTQDLVTGSSPFAVAVDDFDNDNQSDVALVNSGTNELIVMSGYSTRPSARQSAAYFVGRNSRPSSVVIYDFNKDGKLDLAVDNFNDDYILIYNGLGDGMFVRGEQYSTGNKSTPQYQCLADLNHDNRMDMVIANIGTDSFGVLFGQDNGTFATVMQYSTGVGSGPWFAAVGDVNNDNRLDVVSTNFGAGNVGVFIGYGNETFDNMIQYSTGIGSSPYSAVVGDVNNDNHLDIVAAR